MDYFRTFVVFAFCCFPCEISCADAVARNPTIYLSNYDNTVDTTIKPSQNEKVSVLKSRAFSTQAVAFLGFVAACLILLIVFFLYLNKMFCFRSIGGFPCVDRPPKKRFDATTGREYSLDNEDDDDEFDSDDDAVAAFQRHKSVRLSKKQQSSEEKELARLNEPSEAVMEQPPEVSRNEEGAKYQSETIAVVSAMTAAVDMLASDKKTENTRKEECEPILASMAVEMESKDMMIEICANYNSSREEFSLSVNQVSNVPFKDHQYQVHVTMLPAKKHTFRTNYVKSGNPVFKSKFSCAIPSSYLSDSYVRLRLYSRSMAISTSKLFGAAIISLATLPKDKNLTKWFPLQPSEEGLWAIDIVECENEQANAKGDVVPSISVGLAFSALTGRLAVEIGQAYGFGKLVPISASKLETYVKVLIMFGPTAEKLLAQTKTRLTKGFRPNYREKFVFQVAQFQLSEVNVGLMFYTRRKENIGWVAIGSISEPQSSENMHWAELRSMAATHSQSVIFKVHNICPPSKEGSSVTSSIPMTQ